MIMAPRANWIGHLKLGKLLNCGIKLYPASTKSERVSFNKVNVETGNKLKQQYVDSLTSAVVDQWNQAPGYEVGKNEYLIMDKEELDNLKLESTKIINITSFVKLDEVDFAYFDAPYWLVPADKVGQDVYAIIREAMRSAEVVALATVVLGGRRERTIMLQPYGNGIRGMTLRYPYEVREADAYFDDVLDVELDDEIQEMAGRLIKKSLGEFDATKMVDRYEEAIVELVREKQKGHTPKPRPDIPQPPRFSVNIRDLLALSLADEKPENVPQLPQKEEVKEKPKSKSTKGRSKVKAGAPA
jgi:DNA end-binding protein Ku